jgi:tetratricopeptide (TPR) repeat protein
VREDKKCSKEEVNLAQRCGDCLNYDGRYRKAETIYRIVLRYRERVLGPEHSHTLTSVSNLDSVLDSQGKYKEVKAMHRRELRDREKVLGPEHPDTLTSVSNLGSVLDSEGKYEEAEAMNRQNP